MREGVKNEEKKRKIGLNKEKHMCNIVVIYKFQFRISSWNEIGFEFHRKKIEMSEKIRLALTKKLFENIQDYNFFADSFGNAFARKVSNVKRNVELAFSTWWSLPSKYDLTIINLSPSSKKSDSQFG